MHFTDPFHVSTRLADKCNDGTLLLQVIIFGSPVFLCLLKESFPNLPVCSIKVLELYN